MSYELHVDTSVTGAQQLSGVEQAIANIGKQTGASAGALKLFQSILEDDAKAGVKLSQTLKDLTSATSMAGPEVGKLADAYRKQTTETDKATESTKRFHAATRHTVTEMQAASGAIRAMEGHLSMRAGEAFITKILGAGPLLQAIFPVVGATVFVNMIEEGAKKVTELYNAWNPVLRAQRESLKILEESNKHYDGMIQKANQLRLDAYERDHGRPARLRQEASGSTLDAYMAQGQVAYIDQKIAEQNAIIAKAQKGRTVTRSIGHGETAEVYIPGGDNMAAETARAKLPGLQTQREDAQRELTIALAEAAKQRAQAKDIDDKTAGDAADKRAAAAAAAANRQANLDRTSRETYARAFFGDEPSPQRKLSIANAKIEEERAKALREPGANAGAVNKDFDLQKVAAFMTSITEGVAAVHKANAHLDSLDAAAQKHIEQYESVSAELPDFLNAKPGGPTGGRSPQQALRDSRDRERRESGLIGVRGGLAGDSAGQMVETTHAVRLKYAGEEYAALMREAELKHTLADKQIARDDALDQLNQKRYDAAMEREHALLEMALNQKREFQSLAVGFLDAARSGNTAGFMKGQLNKIEDTIAGNAAGMVWPSIQKAMGGMHAGAGTTMGKLLEGTPFGPDPAKAATVDNTLATVANTMALKELAMSASGGGGSAGPGGFSNAAGTFSRLVNGGRAVPGGVSDDGTGETYGLPTDGHPGDYGGEYGPAQNVPGPSAGMSKASKGMAYGAAAIGAGFAAYSGFKKGGAQGALEGTSAILGAASMIPGPQQPFVMAAAMATTLIAGVLGDPKVRRANEIEHTLKTSQYMAPVSIHASMTAGGGFSDFDRFGGTRGSNLSPFPSVEQGFFDYRRNTTVQGRTDSQFGGGAPIIVQVNAMDSKSFTDHSHDIAAAVQHALMTGRSPGLQETLRSM